MTQCHKYAILEVNQIGGNVNKLKMAGLVIAVALVGTTISVFADGWSKNSEAKKLFGAACTHVIGNDGNTYPSHCDMAVYKYVDGGNVCYITDKSNISCVRGE